VVLLALAGTAALPVHRRVLVRQLDAKVAQLLVQEASELRVLAGGRDPATGEPFAGDVQAIFSTFLQRNLPLEGEAFVTYVDGKPYRASLAPHPLLDDGSLTRRWSQVTASQRGEVATPVGPARYLAVPLKDRGVTRGVFVALSFMRAQQDGIDRTLQVGAAVWGSVLVLATFVAWVAAGRVLNPLRLVNEAAREITGSDLSRRIPVAGNDEVAELATTFNEMLDRLEASFANQRAFLDDAGHELRTPITVIRGHLELLGDDADERRETVATVTDELDRMTRIVDDLLLLARAEQPDFLRLEPVDVDVLTRDLANKVQALAERRWKVEATGYGVMVADRHRLTQAVINLVDNAVRNTAPGDEIAVGSAVSDGHVRLWVRDEGPGIPIHEQDRIFERSIRLDGGRRQGGSAGLGLAIVRTVVEAHGGQVVVDSPPGRGATFTVVIPSRA